MASQMSDKVLVAGVGNIFLGDDAFGVEVVRRLAHQPLAEHVQVVDFGIRSYDLAYALMEDWKLVILVDAMPRGDAPGTVYMIEPELPPGDMPRTFDPHTMNPVRVLQLVGALGGTTSRMLVVGCEPMRVDGDGAGQIGLSPPVETAVDQAVRVIQELIIGNSEASAA
jgi:hydrogenase maturation protease